MKLCKLKSFVSLISFLLISAMILSLCSCGGTDYTKKTVTWRTVDDIESLDPQLAKSSAEVTTIINCFDGLMMNENGTITTCAAQSYTQSTDGLTYKFTIKSDMLWSDGTTPVTAADFVFGITRALLPTTKAPFAFLLFAIKNAEAVYNGTASADTLGIKAISNTEIDITLQKPDHNFLAALTHPVAMPCNQAFFDSTVGKYGLDKDFCMSNGAYFLRRWNTDDDYLQLNKFDEYKGTNKGTPKYIMIGFNRTYEDINTAFTDDETDLGELTGDFASELKNSGFLSQAFYNTSYVLLTSPKMTDQNLKKALIYDIDIDALHLNLPDYYDTSGGIVPVSAQEGGNNYRKTAGVLTLQPYNSTKAISLISLSKTAAGKDGIDYTQYTVYYPDGDNDVKQCSGLIVQQWQKELNAHINAAVYEGNDILASLASGEINMAIVPITSVTGSVLGALSKLEPLNISAFNSKLTNLSDNVDAYCKTLQTAEQYLIDNFYAVPLFCEPTYCCMASNISNVYFNATGSYIDCRHVKKED